MDFSDRRGGFTRRKGRVNPTPAPVSYTHLDVYKRQIHRKSFLKSCCSHFWQISQVHMIFKVSKPGIGKYLIYIFFNISITVQRQSVIFCGQFIQDVYKRQASSISRPPTIRLISLATKTDWDVMEEASAIRIGAPSFFRGTRFLFIPGLWLITARAPFKIGAVLR